MAPACETIGVTFQVPAGWPTLWLSRVTSLQSALHLRFDAAEWYRLIRRKVNVCTTSQPLQLTRLSNCCHGIKKDSARFGSEPRNLSLWTEGSGWSRAEGDWDVSVQVCSVLVLQVSLLSVHDFPTVHHNCCQFVSGSDSENVHSTQQHRILSGRILKETETPSAHEQSDLLI